LFLSFPSFRQTFWKQQADRQHSFHPWPCEDFGGCVSISSIGDSCHFVHWFTMLNFVMEYAILVTGALIITRSEDLSRQTSIVLPVSVRCKYGGERHSIITGCIQSLIFNISCGNFSYVKECCLVTIFQVFIQQWFNWATSQPYWHECSHLFVRLYMIYKYMISFWDEI